MRIFVVKKNTIIRAAVFVVLFAIAIIYTQTMAVSEPAMAGKGALTPVSELNSGEKNVAITIDTVFGDDFTDEILKVLKEKNVNATFFVLGAWAADYPQRVAKIIRAGHEIASHSYTHKKYTEISPEQLSNDAKMAKQKLDEMTGKDIKLIRSPNGAYDDTVLQTLYDNGFIPVKWSVDSKDWKGDNADTITNNVLETAKNGSIIMFQSNMMDTPLALLRVIDKLADKGYSFVTLSEGLNTASPQTPKQ